MGSYVTLAGKARQLLLNKKINGECNYKNFSLSLHYSDLLPDLPIDYNDPLPDLPINYNDLLPFLPIDYNDPLPDLPIDYTDPLLYMPIALVILYSCNQSIGCALQNPLVYMH